MLARGSFSRTEISHVGNIAKKNIPICQLPALLALIKEDGAAPLKMAVEVKGMLKGGEPSAGMITPRVLLVGTVGSGEGCMASQDLRKAIERILELLKSNFTNSLQLSSHATSYTQSSGVWPQQYPEEIYRLKRIYQRSRRMKINKLKNLEKNGSVIF